MVPAVVQCGPREDRERKKEVTSLPIRPVTFRTFKLRPTGSWSSHRNW